MTISSQHNDSDLSDSSAFSDDAAPSGSGSSGSGDEGTSSSRKKTTRKKPAAKKAAKKTAKATTTKAAPKATPKATTKKTAKKAAKKAAKKTTKKSAAKAVEADEPDDEVLAEPDEAIVESAEPQASEAADDSDGTEDRADSEADAAPKKKTRKRRRSKKAAGAAAAPATDGGDGGSADDSSDTGAQDPTAEQGEGGETGEGGDGETGEDGAEGEGRGKKRRRRRRRSGGRGGSGAGGAGGAEAGDDDADEQDEPVSKQQAILLASDDDDEPTGDGRLEMVINYVPGEECRVAITEDGQLEELFAEPTDRVSRVGNIYVGKVINVEPSIQAAFVDFGCEENGFLHISDLHPQYFGDDDEATERVGKKTPRRDRPPIQDALRRGQEITVAVLKEGVGTKGPTLTSYLSIPGRFLVMMPGMDKVGMSRKEEDDERRRAAKEILGQLDLPEGFGFILRTAGFDRNKAELKRDLAYLTRLWKDMERRRKAGNKPRPLYSESDLLLRAIRDLMSSDIRRVVIDSEPALRRAAQFMKIAAPRSQAKLARYVGGAPIFHAFGIEDQIEAIHAREVPLPSGGRLVIDQTEALVAIDVNSGKSRSARDAETNAFRTNMEAVDAICRQLRLRDLGGLVVNDLIDMRYASHRKQVEQRFFDRLRRDRAKTTIGTISEFGLMEMTRQRMRGSMESQHFADCPVCHGRGLVQKPDSVAATALRDLAAIIDHEKVRRVEMVVHPRVAGALLSTRRTALTRVELQSGKQIEVRISEALALDRVTFYAYDHNGNDLGLEKMTGRVKRPAPKVVDWVDDSPDTAWAVDPADEADETTAQKLTEEIARLAHEAGPQGERGEQDRERGRDGGRDNSRDSDRDDGGEPGEGGKKKRRRRRRRKGSGEGESPNEGQREGGRDDREPLEERSAEQRGEVGLAPEQRPAAHDDDDDDRDDRDDRDHAENGEGGEGGKKKRRRRRRRGGRGRSDDDQGAGPGGDRGGDRGEDRERDRERDAPRPAAPAPEPKPEAKPEPGPEPKPEAKPKRRGLYSGGRRKLAPSEVARISPD